MTKFGHKLNYVINTFVKRTPGVDFTKGFKTWYKFSTEIRFTMYAHTYHCSIYSTRVYNGKVLTQQVNTEL